MFRRPPPNFWAGHRKSCWVAATASSFTRTTLESGKACWPTAALEKTGKILQYRCRKKDGSYLWMESNLRLYHDPTTGTPFGFVNVVRDISGRKAAEEDLEKAFRLVESLASLDGLTEIANRRRLDQVLEHEWRLAIRTVSDISLLLIDVDHFKAYNDITATSRATIVSAAGEGDSRNGLPSLRPGCALRRRRVRSRAAQLLRRRARCRSPSGYAPLSGTGHPTKETRTG